MGKGLPNALAEVVQESVDSADDRSAMGRLADEYTSLSRCKTERETISWSGSSRSGRLSDDLRGDTALASLRSKAVVLVRGRILLAHGLRLVQAHVDTPHLDLKQHPLHEECQVALMKTITMAVSRMSWLADPWPCTGTVVTIKGGF